MRPKGFNRPYRLLAAFVLDGTFDEVPRELTNQYTRLRDHYTRAEVQHAKLLGQTLKELHYGEATIFNKIAFWAKLDKDSRELPTRVNVHFKNSGRVYGVVDRLEMVLDLAPWMIGPVGIDENKIKAATEYMKPTLVKVRVGGSIIQELSLSWIP